MVATNKQTIAAAFGWTATHHEQHADLQRQSADALLIMLPQRKYTYVLDAGRGPGWMSCHWRERHAQVTVLDLSPPMLVRARQRDTVDHHPAGDIKSLSSTTVTFDPTWSNLVAQWRGNSSTVLHELYRAMRPKGVVVFTTLVQGSLPKLHQAWQAVDECPHANCFLPPGEIEQSLDDVHYQHHIQPITLWFDDVLSTMHSLKGIGTTYLHEGHDPRILARPQLQRLQLVWPQQQRRYPLTYHLSLGVIARE